MEKESEEITGAFSSLPHSVFPPSSLCLFISFPPFISFHIVLIWFFITPLILFSITYLFLLKYTCFFINKFHVLDFYFRCFLFCESNFFLVFCFFIFCFWLCISVSQLIIFSVCFHLGIWLFAWLLSSLWLFFFIFFILSLSPFSLISFLCATVFGWSWLLRVISPIVKGFVFYAVWPVKFWCYSKWSGLNSRGSKLDPRNLDN